MSLRSPTICARQASSNDMAAFPTLTLLRRLACYAAYPDADAAASALPPKPTTAPSEECLPAVCVAELFAYILLHEPTPPATDGASGKRTVAFSHATSAEAPSSAAAQAFRGEAAASLVALCKLSPPLIGIILDEVRSHPNPLPIPPLIAPYEPVASLEGLPMTE